MDWQYEWIGTQDEARDQTNYDSDGFIGEPIYAAFGVDNADAIQGEALYQARQTAKVIGTIVRAVCEKTAPVRVVVSGTGNDLHGGDERITIEVTRAGEPAPPPDEPRPE